MDGSKSKGAQPVREFHTKIWLEYAVRRSGLAWRDFVRECVYRGRARSSLADKWRTGKALPTRLSAQRIERLLSGTLAVFDSPLFPLLEDRPFTVQELRKLFAPYRETRVPLIVWRFPNDEELRERRHWVPTLHEKDTSSLVRRGDIWGFIAAVWVARMCEAQGELDYHFTACMDVYRAAPAALKESWLAPHVDQLFKLLETVRYREISTFIMFDVDLDIIKRQASDPNHEPIREYRPRDPLTHRFVEIEDPVLPAHWIPGTVWRDQQRRREQRRATLKKSHRPSPPTT
ncbi:hypothetical protein [Metallibacterium scheffleri]|nr:hypothetical protein [Metallibacterium scheffleri]